MYPSVFLIGAPKSGTTSLYNWLGQHTKIFAPEKKEPHHFYSPYGDTMSIADYVALYNRCPRGSIGIDGSIWYLFKPAAIKKIVATVANPKFIVCLRSPFEIAPSLHFQAIYTGYEKVTNFDAAWELNDSRKAGELNGINVSGRENFDPEHMAYREVCLLGKQVRNLFEIVDRERVLFCFLEQMNSEPEKVFSRACGFLNLDYEEVAFHTMNPATKWRSVKLKTCVEKIRRLGDIVGIPKGTGALSWLHWLNTKESMYSSPSSFTRVDMKHSFENDIILLSSLIEEDLTRWLHGNGV